MPMLEHPTEWPGAIKGQLTRKVGPLPVWGWGAAIVGAIVAVRVIGKRGGSVTSKSPAVVQTGAFAVGSPGGGYGGGGGTGSTAPSVPGNPATPVTGGIGTNPGGTADGGIPGGVQLPPQNTTDTITPVNMTAPGLTAPLQAAIDKVGSFGGNIRSVSSDTTAAVSDPTQLSLVDWYKYQYAKVAAAQNGVIVGESAAFLQHSPDPAAYLAGTLNGGNISMYGPNAGAPQKALDAAASAEAKRQLGIA